MLTEHEMLYGLIATLPIDILVLVSAYQFPNVHWHRIIPLWLTVFTAAAIVGHFL